MHTGKNGAKLFLATALTAVLLSPLAAQADNTFGLQLGGANADHHGEQMNKVDLGLVWNPHLTWWHIGGWNFGLQAEAHASYWSTGGNVNGHIGEFGAQPMLRFEKSGGYFRPYIEAGSGVRVLTHARFSDTYTLSSAFQFADTAGVGVTFGNRQQYAIGYRFEHISNASIKRPNPGVDFQLVYVQYNFQ